MDVGAGGGAVPLEALLAEREWVTRLARHLVSDRADADDLVQQTWLRSLRHPPRTGGSLRGWLRTVLRNEARQARRSATRRDAREAAWRPRDVPGPDEVVARAEEQRRVAQAVLDLDEPYRSTLLLRFYDELTPQEIAARTTTPIETVRTRTRRGLARLRSRLDASHGGGGSAWGLALLPLAGWTREDVLPIADPAVEGASAGAAQGGLVMAVANAFTKTASAVVVLALAALGGWLVLDRGDVERTEPAPRDETARTASKSSRNATRARVRGTPAAEPGTDPPSADATARRDDVDEAGGTPPDAPPDLVAGPDGISARVTTAGGQAVAGARVRVIRLSRLPTPGEALPEPSREGSTDEHGRFAIGGFAASDRYLVVRLEVPGYLQSDTWLGPGTQGMAITLVRAAPLGGAVVDKESGVGIEGVRLLGRPAGAAVGTAPAFTATTDASGRFAVDVAAGSYWLELGPLYALAGAGAGFVPRRLDDVASGTTDQRIELTRGLSITGTILDAAGRPVTTPVQLRVASTQQQRQDFLAQRVGSCRSEDGSFAVHGLPAGRYDLSFVPATTDAAVVRDVVRDVVAAAVLRDVPAGSAGLTVTLGEGKPLSGRLVDDQDQPVTGKGFIHVVPVGAQIGGPGWVSVHADEAGQFTTGPLEEGRAYEVHAVAFPGHLDAAVKGVFPGSTPVVVVLPRAASIAGTVVGEDGKPVGAGVPLRAVAEAAGAASVGFGSTDEAGRFRVDGLAPGLFTVAAGGPQSEFYSAVPARGVSSATTDLVVRVRRGVELSGRLVDLAGRPLRTEYLEAHSIDSPDANPAWTRVDDEQGGFTLRGLPPGKVRLRCRRGATLVGVEAEVAVPAAGVVITVPSE